MSFSGLSALAELAGNERNSVLLRLRLARVLPNHKHHFAPGWLRLAADSASADAVGAGLVPAHSVGNWRRWITHEGRDYVPVPFPRAAPALGFGGVNLGKSRPAASGH